MRVKVVRTPGELRDEIGHRVMIRKDWEGAILEELTGDDLVAAGFHPKRSDKVYRVLFDAWQQPIAVPSTNLVVTEEDDAPGA